jgi:hypothetical protein
MAPIGGRIVVVHFSILIACFGIVTTLFRCAQLGRDVLPLWHFFLAKSCVDKEARVCRVNEACAACDEENEVCDVYAGARMSKIHSACTERLVLCNCSRAQNGLL